MHFGLYSGDMFHRNCGKTDTPETPETNLGE